MLIDLIRVPDPNCIDDLLDEPLGLLCLAAVLRENGHEVRITDLGGHNFESWKPEIKKADIYGIQLYTPTVYLGVEIAEFIKGKFSGCPVICGGAHPTAIPNSPELKIFDCVVAGEGERAIVEIVNNYKINAKIPNYYKSEFITDLDSLPLPARDLVDMHKYHRKVDGVRCFGIIGSRGCCFNCAFCDQALFGNKIRYRSINSIVFEIKKLIQEYNVRNFEFFDDVFTINKKRLKEFEREVNDLNIIYRCNSRTDVLDDEIYHLLYESGCRLICFGIESGSQKMLNLMNKKNSIEKSFQAIKKAQKAGIIVCGYFLIGFPGETMETIEETIDFIKRSSIDQVQCYTFVPLPGCDVYKNPDRYGVISMTKNFSEFFLVTGNKGLGGRTIDTKFMSAVKLEESVKRIRKFLRNRPTRGKRQDYYQNNPALRSPQHNQ